MVQNPHPLLKLFADCERMKWAHLPVAGGIYDQHPDLLAGFRVIWAAQAEEADRQEKQRARQSGQRPRVAGRR